MNVLSRAHLTKLKSKNEGKASLDKTFLVSSGHVNGQILQSSESSVHEI